MKNTTQDLVSIILPIYNNVKTLQNCLDSILTQTYRNLEIIAIDDKSSDASYEILKRYKRQDKRVRIFRNKKRYGLAICLNRGVRKAKGALITFMDPWDTNTKSRIQRQAHMLASDLKLIAVGSQCAFVNEKNRIVKKSAFPLHHSEIFKSFLSGLTVQFETALIHRLRIPKDALKFQHKTYPVIFSELLLKLMSYGEVTNSKTILYYKRLHAGSLPQSISVLLSHAKLWLQSTFDDERRPSLRSLFTPLVKQA